MYKLPEDQREILRMPFGKIFSNFIDVLPLLSGRKVYSVGDVVTHRLLRQGIIPDVAIIDRRTMRVPCDRIPEYQAHRIVTHNPPGFITDELIESIKDALTCTPALIVVNGEEDLAVIPLVLTAQDGGVVLYGQPSKGVVLREINVKAKNDAKGILSRFIRE